MRSRWSWILVVGVAVGLVQLPANAHHSFTATYDIDAATHLLAADVAQKGAVTRWTIELSSPALLMRNGLTKDDIRPGMDVAIDGPRSKSDDLRIGGTTVFVKSTGRVYSTPTTNSFRDRIAGL